MYSDFRYSLLRLVLKTPYHFLAGLTEFASGLIFAGYPIGAVCQMFSKRVFFLFFFFATSLFCVFYLPICIFLITGDHRSIYC